MGEPDRLRAREGSHGWLSLVSDPAEPADLARNFFEAFRSVQLIRILIRHHTGEMDMLRSGLLRMSNCGSEHLPAITAPSMIACDRQQIDVPKCSFPIDRAT